MHFPRKSLGLTARFAIFFGTELSAAASPAIPKYTARLADGIAEGKTFSNVVNLPDGRAFSVVNKPVAGGGWLATHEDVTERQRSEERIAHMARHDALTDLPNRVLLLERLNHEIKRVKRGECLAVLFSISTNSRALTTPSVITSATSS